MNAPPPRSTLPQLSDDEMAPLNSTDHVSLAVMATELRHIKEAVERIEAANNHHVTTQSWQQRNAFVDEKFINHATDIADLKIEHARAMTELKEDYTSKLTDVWTEIRSKRVSWISVSAVAVAALALLFQIIPLIKP